METSSEEGNRNCDPNEEFEGNVRISRLPHALIVTIPAKRTASSIIFPGLLCFFILYKSWEIGQNLMTDLRESRTSVLSVFVFLLFLWMIFQLFRSLFGHREILRCTDDELEITDFDFGYAWRRRSFLKQDIKRIEFAAVGFSRYGAVTGLRFNAAGKQVKCLRGLLPVEANKVLSELKNLGFDTTADVAMPMMVEIEKSRRKSFWGLFG